MQRLTGWGLAEPPDELELIEGELREAASGGESPLAYAGLLLNDLEEAALSLRPEIGDALEALRGIGAEVAFVTGSGPTAVGLFPDIVAADRGYGELGPEWADALVTGSAPGA